MMYTKTAQQKTVFFRKPLEVLEKVSPVPIRLRPMFLLVQNITSECGPMMMMIRYPLTATEH